jgi:hypothetical protein
MKLTEAEVNLITDAVIRERITIETLRDDLIDHLCCVVENKMSNGAGFNDALIEAMKELAPHGLQELQQETFFLLDNEKTVYMKKVTYLIGLLSTMCYSIGFTFRILHWPGGFEIANYGVMAFVFLFLPMLAVNYLKFKIHKAASERWYMLLGFLSAGLIGLTTIFKILHLQGADALFLISAFVFSFAYLPMLFFNLYQKALRTN